MAILECKFTFFLNRSGAFNLILYLLQLRAFLRDYVDGCSGQLKARRTRKRVYDGTQSAVGEDEAPVNAPKWTTAGYKGSLKTLVEKYTRRTIASSPEPTTPTAPSTAPVDENPSTAAVDEPTVAGPSTTDDVFFLNEDILVDDNILDVDSSSSDDSSEETDKEKGKKKDSSEESDSSSGEEDDDNNNKGKDKEEDSGSSSSEEEEDDRDKGKNEDNKDGEGDKEDDDKDDEDDNKNEEEGDRVEEVQTKHSIKSLLNE